MSPVSLRAAGASGPGEDVGTDCGLDGICHDNPELQDFGEGDDIWQPGDNWIDTDGDGYPNMQTDGWEPCEDIDGGGCGYDEAIYNTLQECIDAVVIGSRCLTGSDETVFYDGNGDGVC